MKNCNGGNTVWTLNITSLWPTHPPACLDIPILKDWFLKKKPVQKSAEIITKNAQR